MRINLHLKVVITLFLSLLYSCSSDNTELLPDKETDQKSEIIFIEDEFNLDHTAQLITVELQSNISDLIITPENDWVVAVEARSLNSYTYQFQIEENTTESNRSTTVGFSNRDRSMNQSIQIKQQVSHGPDLTMAYNLNIIYFIPSDITAPAEYERRLSELMIWLRDFYAKNMERNGHSYRGFGLRTRSATSIELITIKGKLGHDSYPYSGGNGAVEREIRDYFTANPTSSGGDHNLIIIPSYTGDPTSPGGPPFYGVGRTCFALDYEDMDIKYLGENSTKGKLLTKWFGGLAHELGHGLNLPHNSQLKNDPLGTTLMGAGNYTLGLSPTFLSAASCALLNNCQVFSPTKKLFYQANSSATIDHFQIKHTATTINISGKFNTQSKPINAINIYIDDYPYMGVNENYDAESWSISDLMNSEFDIKIPINAITQTDRKFRVRTLFLFDDGTNMEESHDFDRDNLVDYSFVTEIDTSREGWQISTSSSENDSPASNMLDGNINTFWHSQWQSAKPEHPHTITIIMKEATTIRGLSFVQRQSLHGAINQFEIEVSSDGTTWEPQGIHNLAYTSRRQFIYLPQTKSVKMFRIKTVSNHTNSDPEIAVLAEIGAFE